jgi:hypothetical protein
VRSQRHKQQAAASHNFHQKTSHLPSLLLPKDAPDAGGGAEVAIIYR